MLTHVGANGIAYVNPLLKVLREAERDAKKYGEALGLLAKRKGRPGRNPEAVLGPLGARGRRRVTRRSDLRAVEGEDAPS